MASRERPLSPHLQIYRKQITSVLSITHRMTGVVLSAGAFMLAWWLLALMQGPETYSRTADCLASPLGLAALVVWSWCLMYHLCNGLRHLVWDTGRGFSISSVNRSGWIVVFVSLLATTAIWVCLWPRVIGGVE